MKVIKESINNLPEVDEKAQVVVDPVMGKAKADSEENQTEFDKQTELTKFDRKKAFTSGEHQPKPEEAEQELKKINLDESLFNESLNEGKEIVAVADLAKAAKEILLMHPWKTKEILGRNQSILRDYLDSGLSAKEYLQKQVDYYGSKYADWFAAGGPTKYVQNFVEGLSDDKQKKISKFVESLTKQIEEGYVSVPEFIEQDMQNGNAFWIMGYCADAMQECGLSDEITEMQERAMSGNYDNLCAVCDEYIQRCNEIADTYDDEFEYEPETRDIEEFDDPDFYNEMFKLNM